MNLYFLVNTKTLTIVSNNIPGQNSVDPQILPVNFYNVSNFNNIEFSDPSLLVDLSWMDLPDLGFWLAVVGTKPEINYYKKIIATNTIISESKTVNVSYSEINLSPEEIQAKNSKMRNSYVPVRDSYLKLTDFTQLPDAPITDNARIDFAVFRQQLRTMFEIADYSQLAWPPIPTSAPNITIPPFPPIDFS